MVIGYLMKLRRWRLSEAYKWVKEHRPATVLAPGATLLPAFRSSEACVNLSLCHVITLNIWNTFVLSSSSLGRPLLSWLSVQRLFKAGLCSHPESIPNLGAVSQARRTGCRGLR